MFVKYQADWQTEK